MHMHSQAARENALLTCISVAAVSVWTLAWCVMASPTVLTVQMRVLDVLNATAPVCRLLSVTTSVSAPQMARSAQNRLFPTEPQHALMQQQHISLDSLSLLFCSDVLLCRRFQTRLKCCVLCGCR